MSSFSQNNISELLKTINKNPLFSYKCIFDIKDDKRINRDTEIKKIKEKLSILTDLVISYSNEIMHIKDILKISETDNTNDEIKEETKEEIENSNNSNNKSFVYLMLFPCLTYISYLSYKKLCVYNK
jgi:hypothetical protein